MVIYATQDTEGRVEELLQTGYETVKSKDLQQKGKNGARHHHKNQPVHDANHVFDMAVYAFSSVFRGFSLASHHDQATFMLASSRTVSGRLPCRRRVKISPSQSFDVRRRACCSISLPCSRASLLFWLQARQGLQEDDLWPATCRMFYCFQPIRYIHDCITHIYRKSLS